MPGLRIAIAVLLLTACSKEGSAPSPEQNRQLDSAETMLNEAPLELESVTKELPEQE